MEHPITSCRVFIGSTVPGFAAERGALEREVFPALRSMCQRVGCSFEALELPVGSGPDEGLDPRALSARLAAIARGDVLVCLLGGREDWRPLPENIPAAEFREIEKRVPPQSAAFLHEWYRADHNAVPPAYVLQPRGGVFAQPELRERYVERPLASLLLEAVRGIDLPAAARMKYEASAIEQEVQAAGHALCLVPEGAADAVKQRLRERLAGDYVEYRPGDLKAFVARALAALTRILKAGIGRQEKNGADRETAAQTAFARERCRFFTGRERPLQQIAEYLEGTDPHPLVIAGQPGAGKSALLAQAAERYLAAHQGAAVIFRSIGATRESAEGRPLLEGICRRLSSAALESAGYEDLVWQLPERLKAAPAVVFVDALDYLPPLEEARDLDWLPPVLPPGARVVVSSAPGDLLFKLRHMVPAANLIELEPMKIEEAQGLLDLWLGAAGRTLTEPQRARVLEGFRACAQPLYLRLAFEEARRWRSYDPPEARFVGRDIPEQIGAVLERHAASAAGLASLAAARFGLSEEELAALAPLDVAAMQPYLIERAADGIALLSFTWRVFAAEVERRFLAGEQGRERRKIVARYFDVGAPSARRLSEMARQQAYAGQWDALESTLSDFDFIEAKSRAGMVRDLVDDYRVAEHCWRSEKKGPPPWSEWAEFVFSQARAIESWVAQYPSIVFQQAFNQSRQGRVAQAAAARLEQGHGPRRPWFERVNRPDRPPHRDCRLTLEGHRGAVSALALACGGAYAVSGGADGALRVWSLSTGACVRLLEGHSAAVNVVTAAGDEMVASASADGTVRVWSLYSGECLHVLEGHASPVHALAEVAPHCVASGAEDGGLRLWGLTSGDCLATFTGHEKRVNCILPLSGGRIASASQDGSVRIWRVDGSPAATLSGHGGPVLHLGWIPGALCASAASGKILLWDLEMGRPRDILSGHTGAVAGTALLDPARLVSWSHDHTIRLWSLVDGSQLTVMHYHDGPVVELRVLEDGRMLSASEDSTLRLWSSSGETAGILRGHRGPVSAAVLSGPPLAVSASCDGTLRVWDLDGATMRAAVDLPADVVRAEDLASVYVLDATTAVSLTKGPSSMQVWDLAGGRCIQSAGRDSAAGRELWERIRASGESDAPSEELSITGVVRRQDEPALGLALRREARREGALLDRESRPLAVYPLMARPYAQAAGQDTAIAFDARTREPHIVRAHSEHATDETPLSGPSDSPGPLRSLFRKLLGR
jgi:WD40 repeat protein